MRVSASLRVGHGSRDRRGVSEASPHAVSPCRVGSAGRPGAGSTLGSGELESAASAAAVTSLGSGGGVVAGPRGVLERGAATMRAVRGTRAVGDAVCARTGERK